MEAKTQQLLNLIKVQDWKKSLAIASNFKMNFTKEEKRNLEIAYESMTGKANFYQQLGLNTDEAIAMAIEILITYSKNRN